MRKQKTGITKITGVYKVTSPTGKSYVGQSLDIHKRWHQYKKHFFQKQYKLYYSIQKYGYENHIFTILEECAELDLNIRERFWQDFYNVVEDGLNLTLTNSEEKKKIFSQEVKDKISKAQKGKTLTLEHRQKLSEARKQLPDEIKKANGYKNRNRKRSEQFKDNLSDKKRGQLKSEQTKQKMRKPKSELHRLNMSLANIGKPSPIKGIPDEIATCPHCQKSGGNSGMKRWHFDKCKKKLLL
jgi:group I intron endonuclease